MQSITGFWSVEHFSLSFLCWCWHSCSVKFTGHWEERISSAASLPDLGDEAMKICWYKYHWYYSEDIRWICQDENPEENIENWRPNTGKKKRLRFWFNAEMSAQLHSCKWKLRGIENPCYLWAVIQKLKVDEKMCQYCAMCILDGKLICRQSDHGEESGTRECLVKPAGHPPFSAPTQAPTEIFYTSHFHPHGQIWAESWQSFRPFSGRKLHF